MKLLITLPWMPYPLSDGGKQGSFNMIEALQYKMDIVLVYPVFDKSQLEYEQEMFTKLRRVKLYPFYYFKNKGGWRSQYFLFRLHRLLTKNVLHQPYMATPVYEREYIDFVLDVIGKEHIDAVQNEYYEQLFLAYALPDNLKRVFIQHEIQYINKLRNINQMSPCPSDLLMIYNKVKQEEITAMNQYDMVVTMTETDRNILLKDGVRVPVFSSPSFIPLPQSSFFKPCDKHLVSFIGGGGHFPNFNGVKWFLEQVWPKVLERDSEMTLQIIGNWSERHRKSLSHLCNNVIFKGFIANLSETISGTIVVVPILIGSGIRMKILEAVNYFSPFVATSIGVEGLSFETGKECIVTDDPEKFADAVLKIQISTDIQKEMAENAYKKLIAEYSPKVLSNRRCELYNELNKK